jgi:hypothetical protein
MNTLPSSSSKIAVDKFLVSPFLNRPKPRVLRSQKVSDFGFLHLITVQHKAIHPVVACLSSETQVFSVSRISLLFLGSRCFWFFAFVCVGDFLLLLLLLQLLRCFSVFQALCLRCVYIYTHTPIHPSFAFF